VRDMTSQAGRLPRVRDVMASLREFFLKVVRHVYAVVVGVIGGVLGVVSAIYADLQKPSAKPSAALVPLWIWLPLLAAGFLIAIIWAFHDVRVERDVMKARALTAESALEDTRATLEGTRTGLESARRELEARQPSREPERLEAHYDQSPVYRHTKEDAAWIIEHRVGVFNSSGQPAHRVRMYLVKVEPYPRNIPPGYEPVIPYTVPMLQRGDPSVGRTIEPGQEELWVIGYTAVGSDRIMSAGGFTSQRWQGTPWQFDSDERWRLSYRIVCDGRPDVPFSIVVTAEDGQLRLHMEG